MSANQPQPDHQPEIEPHEPQRARQHGKLGEWSPVQPGLRLHKQPGLWLPKQPGVWLLHPFLFGVYPAFALLAYNIEETHPAAAWRALLASLLAAAALLLVWRLLLRSWGRAAILTTLTSILFFSYGHVYNALENVRVSGFPLGRHRLFIPLWIGLFLGGVWWATRPKRDLGAINRALNLAAAVLLVFPLIEMGQYAWRASALSSQGSTPGSRATEAEISHLHLPEGRLAPDIYYIILDGYARDDILARNYNLNNTPFLQQLDQMGFYVARCSQSNYAQTQLSLASSLNFNYLEALDSRYQAGNTSRVGLADLIQHSAVRRALERLGYRTVAFETGYEATQLLDADPYLGQPRRQGINDFENLFIRTTAARVISEGISFLNLPPDWEARDEIHRQQVLFTLNSLPGVPDLPGPKFVFAHIVSPHWPHVFGPNGEPVHEHPDSPTGYRNQVMFINQRIIPILKEILQRSENPPLIIIQGDHGSVIESPTRRMSILNAYYLPEGGQALLYENISPVNTFRTILNDYFGDQLPLLPDQSYYSTYDLPFNYEVVPNRRPGCQETPQE